MLQSLTSVSFALPRMSFKRAWRPALASLTVGAAVVAHNYASKVTEKQDERSARKLLDIWYGQNGDRLRPSWFCAKKDDGFRKALFEDREIFDALALKAISGELDLWEDDPQLCLALVLLLDQIPRTFHHGSRAAYAGDAKAQQVARKAIKNDVAQTFKATMQLFLYMPLLHSENIDDQQTALQLFTELVAHAPELSGFLPSVHAHHDAMQRFGRFPERNEVLGRASTMEEKAFLIMQPSV